MSHLLVDDVAGGGVEAGGDDEDIRHGRQLRQAQPLRPELRLGRGVRPPVAVEQPPDAEWRQPPGDGEADTAEAEDTDGLPDQGLAQAAAGESQSLLL